MSPIHKNLASGRWHELSLAEQMGNIGSEVSRSFNWYNRDKSKFESAAERTFELFDLSLSDPRWEQPRLREIARAREVYSSMFFSENKSQDKSFLNYFDQFAIVSRLNKQ